VADHQQRVALLEAIARRYELKLFGNIAPGVPASSPLHRCFQGEAWGADMYQALRRSLITLNSHIDMVGRAAGNARLFEATGVAHFCSPISRITCKRCLSQTARWWPGVQSTSASQ
jgi:spore maturation protein CgeB